MPRAKALVALGPYPPLTQCNIGFEGKDGQEMGIHGLWESMLP